MAVPTNTLQTFSMVGIKEDVTDIITMTDFLETPFYSGCKKKSRKNRTPEWMVERLSNPNPQNKNIEGDDASNDTFNQPVREKNVVQLFDKVIQVSSTSRAVDTFGRDDELARLTVMAGQEIKRDIEARITGNFASVLGASGTAGECAGAAAFLKTNVSRGASGANGGYNSGSGLIVAATDGTPRQLTETLFKNVIASAAKRSAKPNKILVNAEMKQRISTAFVGVATQYNQMNPQAKNTIIGTVDIYKSDFGLHEVMFDPFLGHGAARDNTWTADGARTSSSDANRDVLVLDMATWAVDFLQPMKTSDLAKTGHSDRKMLACELTLECTDERKNGIVADVTV